VLNLNGGMASCNVTTLGVKREEKITWEIKDCFGLLLIREREFSTKMIVGKRTYTLYLRNNNESISCVLELEPKSGEHESYCEISARTQKYNFTTSQTRLATFDYHSCYWTFENFLNEDFLNKTKKYSDSNSMRITCELIRLESLAEVCLEAKPAVRTSSGTSPAINRLWRTGFN
jgi:hypothetical protein